MLELRFIRENLGLVGEKMRFRGLDTANMQNFAEIDQKRRELLSEVEGLRNKRKTASQKIAELKKFKQPGYFSDFSKRQYQKRLHEIAILVSNL